MIPHNDDGEVNVNPLMVYANELSEQADRAMYDRKKEMHINEN